MLRVVNNKGTTGASGTSPTNRYCRQTYAVLHDFSESCETSAPSRACLSLTSKRGPMFFATLVASCLKREHNQQKLIAKQTQVNIFERIEMSDDEDYMSDKFLQATEKLAAPSLLYRQSERRQMELLKRRVDHEAKMKDKYKPMRVIEQEKREEGLSSAISSSNKGFEMLMKMGYKPGQGIGKTESGISEPIGIDIKGNRMGLGKTVVKKPVKKSNPVEKLDNMKTDDFRIRLALKKAEQLAEVDLLKSQRVCEQLDTHNEIVEPHEAWYWPCVKKAEESDDGSESEPECEEEDEDTEKLTIAEKLEILTKYLRDKYFYCTWCGATYEDEDDLRDNCPGGTRNDH